MADTARVHEEAARSLGRPSAQLPELGPDELASELEVRGGTLRRAWRGVVALGPPDRETARSYAFKHGFRGGWEAHQADPTLEVNWIGPMLDAYRSFLQREGLWDSPSTSTDARALMNGFAGGIRERAAKLREAGLWPAEEEQACG